jgi:hypothetical protein
VEQVKNRILGTEDKVEELDQIVKDHETMQRKHKWHMQEVWAPSKHQIYESWV